MGQGTFVGLAVGTVVMYLFHGSLWAWTYQAAMASGSSSVVDPLIAIVAAVIVALVAPPFIGAVLGDYVEYKLNLIRLKR